MNGEMSLLIPNSIRPILLRSIRPLACLLVGFCVSGGQAETAGRVLMMNGQVVPGWVQELTDEGLVFKTSAGREGTIPIENVRELRLREPADFQSAAERLGESSAEDAVRVLEGYADASDPGNYYPVPGNLASRATYLLLQHYRQLGRVEEAARWARAYDPDLLPQAATVPWLGLYRKLAKTPGDDFFAEAGKLGESADPDGLAEITYLTAVAYELRGEVPEALAEHGRVYSPQGSQSNPLGERSLDRSINLLRNGPVAGIGAPESLVEGLLVVRERLYGPGG